MPKLKEEGPKTNRFVFGTINKSCILVLVVIGTETPVAVRK
jgi:hypothetical protein